ncbi:hypothetical protein T484DRAFT_1783116 [Baffinella frigidus]|nr:hypothetical protein T484DRAFT_1783116 [Cryptophyta sp. CCMP2293]
MVLGWLGLFPMIVFAAKYANGTHDDFEFVAKPLASLAWLFSLWILNMEVARDLRECWILKTFWAASALAATAALPTVVISAEANGFGSVFYAYIAHYVLYLMIVGVALRFPHESKRDAPEWAALAKHAEGKGAPEWAALAKHAEGKGGKKGEAQEAFEGVLSVVWRARCEWLQFPNGSNQSTMISTT